MKVTGGSLTPHQAWAMSLTEALGMCLGRAALNQQGRQRTEDQRPYEDRSDGTRAYKINTMAKLATFVRSGKI